MCGVLNELMLLVLALPERGEHPVETRPSAPDLVGPAPIDLGMLRWMPTTSLVLLVVNLPFVSTLEPSAVIDDPAMILMFFGLLLAVSSRVASIRPADS